MLTEFDVRKHLDEIEQAPLHPMRKARRLLAISRKVRMEARKLGQCVSILANDGLEDQAERMRGVKARLVGLNREVMDRARSILSRARQGGPGIDTTASVNYQPFET